MESNKIATVSLTDAAEKLREQIRSAFVELLTPEQWQAMIKAELEAFTKKQQPPRGHWNQELLPSVLTNICRQEFESVVKAELKKALEGQQYAGWDNTISTCVKEWLTENRDALIQSTIMQLAGLAAQNAVNAMRNL